MFRRSAIVLAGACLLASAQMRDNTDKQLDCKGNRGNRQARSCEVREQSMASAPSLSIDSGTNGGIQVKGWSKPEILVRARVEAWAAGEARAKSIAGQVKVVAQSGRVSAKGPSNLNREGWSVSFEIFAPHRTGVTAKAHNGGLTLSDLHGALDASTVNGGLHFSRLAGKVQGTTRNGGVGVVLSGDRWEGDSLDVRTTNGGVDVEMPGGYGAQLEAGTVNGGLHIGFPVNVTGRIDRRVSTKIGAGGPPLRFHTTNGGVQIHKPGEKPSTRRVRPA
ncbi:MAG: hypothetical protein HY822_21040 [Acidobacteria bacterium]|nr:hypothetical protein [Acidobacteriota bacterium]